jgi:chemotaxis protein histidine kinase CheA
MPKQTPDRVYGITPPNLDLQRKIGGPLLPLEESRIDQVTRALEELAEGMKDWIRIDLERLNRARHAFLSDSQSQECIDELHRAAHDLKGLGQTYGFPTVSVIADTLCTAITRAIETGVPPEELVNAHVDALRAVVNLNLRDANSKPARELLGSLQSLVEKKMS